jgi:hypothetical protein
MYASCTGSRRQIPTRLLSCTHFRLCCAVSPCFVCPCTCRDRVRQIISSAKLFQRGDWKGLWETALCLARKEIDTNNTRKHNHAKRDTSSIRVRVVYAEHCARKGSLSKANQAITSTSIPNADPINIDLLRTNHPETAHPDRDPVRLTQDYDLDRRIWRSTGRRTLG